MKAQSLFDHQVKPALLYSGVTVGSRGTSHEAARENQDSGRRLTQCDKLLAAYRRAGEHGITDGEASERLGILRHVTPARRRDLMKQGFVFAVGETRNGAKSWILRSEG